MPDDTNVVFAVTEIRGHQHFLKPPPLSLFHYTNLAGAAGIAKSHALWLTKITYLNDLNELRYCISLTQSYVAQFVRDNASVSGVQILDRFAKQLDSFNRTNICVASFCESGDLLSMWRGYGNSGQGVALEFKSEALAALAKGSGLHLIKCVYDYRQQSEIVGGVCDYLLQAFSKLGSADIIGYVNTLFLSIAPALKAAAFAEEQEWRLVSRPISVNEKRFSARETARGLVPYAEFEFKANLQGRYEFLSYACMGPSDRAHQNGEGLSLLMRRNLTDLVGVRYSQIPYRSY